MAVADTLRGYRTQFLYTIYRVLTSNQKEVEVFRPEGTEDLDVLVDGCVTESIQVKNYLCGDVKYYNLQSGAHKTSFFRRGISTLKSNPGAKLVLFSFHGIDKSLTDKKLLAKKLRNDRSDSLKPHEVKKFQDAFDTLQKEEKALVDEISSILKQSFAASNPQIDIQYLTQWIYERAERNEIFKYTDLIKARFEYITYLNEHEAAMNNLA